MSEHGKPARQARDEFPATARVYGDGVLVEMQVSKADYEAMCVRIDTLTAQVRQLATENDDLRRSRDYWVQFRSATLSLDFDAALNELRSLRAAVARWAKEFNTPDDFSCERTEALVTAVEGLFALVPSDNSWETELAEGYTPSNPHTPEHVRDNQSNEVPS